MRNLLKFRNASAVEIELAF